MSTVLEGVRSGQSRCGVGFSRAVDECEAVEEARVASAEALDGAGIDAVLVFATAGYDQDAIAVQLATQLPPGTPVIGCSGEGIICHGVSSEQANALVLVAFSSDSLRFVPVFSEGLSGDEERCGVELAEQVSGLPDAQVLLLFPDGLAGNVSKLFPALDAGCPNVEILGGTAGDMLAFNKTFQYADGRALSNAVCGLVICGPVDVTTQVNHGCRPVGREMTVTESDGRLVGTMDDRPAWEVMQDYVGNRPRFDAMDSAHFALGRRVEVPSGVDYGDYIIRMPLGVNLETGEVMFPGGLEQGTVVRLTRRDPTRITESVVRASCALRESAPNAFVVLQFDCAGRGGLLFGDRTTASIAQPVQDAFDDCPVVGLHTFGEIASLGGATEFHNYTVVLVALSEGE